MGFPKQGYWSGLSFPSPGDFLTQGSPALAGRYLPLSHLRTLDSGVRLLLHTSPWASNLPFQISLLIAKPGIKVNISVLNGFGGGRG